MRQEDDDDDHDDMIYEVDLHCFFVFGFISSESVISLSCMMLWNWDTVRYLAQSTCFYSV